MSIVVNILMVIASIALIISVLLQSSDDNGLGALSGTSAETFFGKEKGSSINNKLSKLTTVVAIVFALLVLVSYFIQDTVDLSAYAPSAADAAAVTESLGETVVDGAAAEGTAEEPAAEGEVTEP